MKLTSFLRLRSFPILALTFLTAHLALAGGRSSSKVPEDIDLPSSFDVDFKLAAQQRSALGVSKAPDDASAQTGAEVFESLTDSPMVSGFNLPYKWTFRVLDSPAVNAESLPDGEVAAYKGMSRMIGTNRGLWAAVLSHEVAHVARRHGVKMALYHEYIEQQIRYWQIRGYYGDKNAGWAILGLRVGGAIGEKKLSRNLEHDADIQGMLLMARAGYHPDYVFAMHHMLRIQTGEQSKFGAFFSSHPRWETRDQRTEKAYVDALSEYNRLWPNPATSPGGTPPAVAFLGDVHGEEDKQKGTGDLLLSVSCRNAVGPVALAVHLIKSDGQPVQSEIPEYRDAAGNASIRELAKCDDKDAAVPTIVHIPSELVSEHDRKVKAQVDFLGADNELLERSKVFDLHFPKPVKTAQPALARVCVGDAPVPPAQPMQEVAKGRANVVTVAAHREASLPIGAVVATPTLGATALIASDDTPISADPHELIVVSIVSDPAGADVFVDSKGMGTAPKQLRLNPGLHSIQIVKQGYKDWTTRIVLEDTHPANVNAKLEK